MRILLVTQYFWPENFRINDLAIDLKNRGHSVTVLTGIPNYPKGHYFSGYGLLKNRRQEYQGIKIIRVPLIPRGSGRGIRLALNYFSFAFCAMMLVPCFCRASFDIIFVYEPSPITVGLPAILLRKLKKIPLIFWVQDLWPESLSATGAVSSPRILNWVAKLTKWIYDRCNLILVQSRAFIPAITSMGIPTEKIAYFPNAAEDLYKTKSEQVPGDQKPLPTGFRIIYTGNIGAAQSFETIISAAQLLKEYDIHWIIVGDGRQRVWLKEQVSQLGLEASVHLVGQRPLEEMPYYLGQADVLLLSLKKDPIFALTIPSKLQSYLASGKPLIASLDGEPARIIEESQAGLVSPAEDVPALAKNILAMYNMSSQALADMGARGRQYFEVHFEKHQLLAQLESWMKSLQIGV